MKGSKCQNLTLRQRAYTSFILCLSLCSFSTPAYVQPLAAPTMAESSSEPAPITTNVEELKKAALELNRDLLILEEELLFPANTQLTVFLSIDTGTFFSIDSVKLSIDDQLVASHLYTVRQQESLSKGGIQRLYIGNIKSGPHEVTAIFNGMGPDKREYKRGATLTIDKEDDPIMLELKVMDSTANMQPDFEIKEWQL